MDNDTVLIYLDDIIIPSKDEVKGLEKLRRVLDTAGEHGVSINWAKCKLLTRRIEYLGYIVEGGTIKLSEKKTAAVTHFPRPTNVKGVQSFLGLTGYFRKFIPHYAITARPLSQLLKDNVNYEFGPNQEQSFQALKKALT